MGQYSGVVIEETPDFLNKGCKIPQVMLNNFADLVGINLLVEMNHPVSEFDHDAIGFNLLRGKDPGRNQYSSTLIALLSISRSKFLKTGA